MPELPEVERARKSLEQVGKGRLISDIITFEDSIVFSGITHQEFATSVKGKKVLDVKRKGKNFYMILDSPPHPVLHLGMTGSTQVGGQAALIYRSPRASNDPEIFPPKYTKMVLTFSDASSDASAGEAVAEWAFCDSRRLARIKLIDAADPETLPPLSLLGRDAHLDLVSVDQLAGKLRLRKAPIKAILLDQNGIVCGLGNWMVDEILYQARLHPNHTGCSLTPQEIQRLHHWIAQVTEIGVAANADHSLFPDDWLFAHRWSKGKKGKSEITVDGTTHEITFVTVGGRTSAIVEALQILPDWVEQAINDKLALLAQKKAEKAEKAGKVEEGEEGETGAGPSKGKGKEKAEASTQSKVKGKGKRKAVEIESDEGEAQETASDGDESEAKETEDSFAENDEDYAQPVTSPYFGKSKSKKPTSTSAKFTLPDSLVSPSKSVKVTKTKKVTRKVVKVEKKVVAKTTKRKSKRVEEEEESE